MIEELELQEKAAWAAYQAGKDSIEPLRDAWLEAQGVLCKAQREKEVMDMVAIELAKVKI